MHSIIESYRKNADAARTEAMTSPYPNVRERAARSAEVWEAMIDAYERTEAMRRPYSPTTAGKDDRDKRDVSPGEPA